MSAPAFLNDVELETLTGYVKPSKQIEYLVRNRVPHRVNARNRPVVRRDEKDQPEVPEMGPVR